MSVTVPVAITALPTPPTTADPLNFDTRADAFVLALVTLRNEINAISTVNYDNAVDAAASATSAAPLQDSSQTVSNAVPRLSPGISHLTYLTACVRFTPSYSD